MFKIAIIEDNINDYSLLKSYLNKFSQENNIEFNIQHFENGIRFLDKYSANYEIIFMDVDMPYMNGLEISKKLREIDKFVILIFVTNLAQYAVNGYEVDALDYIVKPISYFNFSIKLQRAIERLNNTFDTKINIKTKDKIEIISCKDIIYIEVFDNKLVLHTPTKTIETIGHLYEIEQKLTKCSFFRISRYYLVNMNYVLAIEGSSVLLGKESLPISRRKKSDFISALTEFYQNRKGI
ncbi:MAG: LytTR family DNA-binding domain-containing protein [Bacilli bacterium]